MVVVIIAYVLLNSLFTSLIQPYFIGDAVGVSVTMTLISLVFWGWVLGPLGAILAIPLTLLVKAVLIDADPNAAWAETLVGSTRHHRREAVTAAPSDPDPPAGLTQPASNQPARLGPGPGLPIPRNWALTATLGTGNLQLAPTFPRRVPDLGPPSQLACPAPGARLPAPGEVCSL